MNFARDLFEGSAAYLRPKSGLWHCNYGFFMQEVRLS